MRYLSVMRRPADFSKSIDIAASIMTVLFVLTGGVGYWRLGADFDAAVPATSVIPEGTWYENLQKLYLYLKPGLVVLEGLG